MFILYLPLFFFKITKICLYNHIIFKMNFYLVIIRKGWGGILGSVGSYAVKLASARAHTLRSTKHCKLSKQRPCVCA